MAYFWKEIEPSIPGEVVFDPLLIRRRGTHRTTFQGTCREWNVTFHLYSGGDQLGDALKVLCPGDDTDDPFAMPHGVNMMAIR